ncbi:hypothetical protein N0824_00859 [Microcystis sp. 0824]|nr:hypothetical protein N0824_00859 [Microcystis sp. 0824]
MDIKKLFLGQSEWWLDPKFFPQEKLGVGKALLSMAQFPLPEIVI